MPRPIIHLFILLAVLWTSAGLITAEPVFDEINSMAAEVAPGFIEFEAVWKAEIRGQERNYPYHLKQDARAVEVGDMVILQRKTLGGYGYIGLSLTRSDAPLICEFFGVPYLKSDARRFGFRFEKIKRAQGYDVLLAGDRAALAAYIRNVFIRRSIYCQLFRTLN